MNATAVEQVEHVERRRGGRRWRARWPEWISYAAGAWSLGYGLLALVWTLGGPGFPFGENDPNPEYSALAGLRTSVGAPVIAAVCLLGVVVALAMSRLPRPSTAVRTALLAYAWLVAAVLFFVVCDYRVLGNVAYGLMLVFKAYTWQVWNQIICVGGGLLWIGAAVAYLRRTREACGNCGRTDTEQGWTRAESAARWGRWAAYLAALIPTTYAITRWAWALGIPLGTSEHFLQEGLDEGGPYIWIAGAALATMGFIGAILTLGLVARWGEIFPRWMPVIRGRRVPPALAIVPATLVAVMVTIAGVMYIRLLIKGEFETKDPAAWAPELAWPVWGAALGAAAYAYYLRRRGRCRRCGRS